VVGTAQTRLCLPYGFGCDTKAGYAPCQSQDKDAHEATALLPLSDSHVL
jgi:hypothetical protein